jgi:hypothetical protein
MAKTPDLAATPQPQQQTPPASHHPFLSPEDEQEIEKMFQRLKSVGRLDSRGSDEQ